MNILNFTPNIIIWCEIIISLMIILFILIGLHCLQYHIHEYGHILELKKSIYKNIREYKKEMKSNKINIQVIKFKGILIPTKIKTYSDYFEFLKNKKQECEYQNIIKNIAISGYEFSKNIIITYKLFWIMCFSIWISISTFTLFTIFYIGSHTTINITINIKLLYLKLLSILVLILILIVCIIFGYLLLCEAGYGSAKTINSDCYIYHYPKNFEYTTLEEDKKYIKKDCKILLDIMIALKDIENPKISITSKDILYNFIKRKYTL